VRETETVSCRLILQTKATPMARRQNVKAQLIDTVTELCRNALQFESELTVEFLIGITVDNNEIILVNINETLKRPLDIIGSVCANLPDISNSDALNAYLVDYFARDTGSVAKVSKRRRHWQPSQDGVHTTTVQTGLSSPHIANQKRRHSESCSFSSAAHMDDESASDNCPEADVFLRSSESGTAGKVAGESPQVSRDRSERRRRVKVERCDGESVAHVNSDDGTVQSEQDDGLNIGGRLSADRWQRDNAAAEDVGGGDPCKTSKRQRNDNPSNRSVSGDGSQFVISNVFSVKKEPISDSECGQQSPALQHGPASDREPPDGTQVSLIRDRITATSPPDPLQVGCILGYWTTHRYANSRIANSRTGHLADAIGDFACLVFLFGGICETASCPVRDLSSPRVD